MVHTEKSFKQFNTNDLKYVVDQLHMANKKKLISEPNLISDL